MCEQINYVLDENELLRKSLNSIFILVFNRIKQLNKGEKLLVIMQVDKIKIILLF